MKQLKLGVIAFAALGLVSILLLMDFKIIDAIKHDAGNTILVLAGFIVPLVMGIMGLTKPPFLQWQAGVALAGFALVFVKFRLWKLIPHIADIPGAPFKLLIVAVLGGIVVSILALVKPEPK